MSKIRGYDYDADNACIVEYKKNGDFDRCRPLIDCKMCINVTRIDVVDEKDINQDVFYDFYAYSAKYFCLVQCFDPK